MHGVGHNHPSAALIVLDGYDLRLLFADILPPWEAGAQGGYKGTGVFCSDFVLRGLQAVSCLIL